MYPRRTAKEEDMKIKDMEIKTSFGGPCVYKLGILPDGRETGRIQDIGQSEEELYDELMSSLSNGRDDVNTFISRI